MMERMLQQMNHPSGRLQAFEQLRRFVHQQRQQQARQIQQIKAAHKQPAANAELSENRNGIRLTVDLPGVQPSDVSVSHEHGVLTVTACRKHLSLDNVCVKKQKVQRRYAVNTDVVDTEKLTATLAHGVLTLHAPKKQAAARSQPAGQISVATAQNEQTAHQISVLATTPTPLSGKQKSPEQGRPATPKTSNQTPASPPLLKTNTTNDRFLIESSGSGSDSSTT